MVWAPCGSRNRSARVTRPVGLAVLVALVVFTVLAVLMVLKVLVGLK